MISELSLIPLWGWVILGVLLFSQSLWLFRNAQKNGVNPWFWGIWGLLHVPTPLVVYWLVVRKGWQKIWKIGAQ